MLTRASGMGTLTQVNVPADFTPPGASFHGG